jgi:hypothetical protein
MGVLMTGYAFAKPEIGTIALRIFMVFDITAMMQSHKSIAKQIIALLMVVFEPYNFHRKRPSTDVYLNEYVAGEDVGA